MKINFPLFKKNTRQWQSLNQAYRSMQVASNPELLKNTTPPRDYLKELNRETYYKNQNPFKKLIRTLQIMFKK